MNFPPTGKGLPYMIMCGGEPFGGAATIEEATDRIRMYRGPAGSSKPTRAQSTTWSVKHGDQEVASFGPIGSSK